MPPKFSHEMYSFPITFPLVMMGSEGSEESEDRNRYHSNLYQQEWDMVIRRDSENLIILTSNISNLIRI